MKLEDNFFTLLGLPQQFEVDLKLLKKNSRDLQRKYHPDRYCNATPQEQRLAAQFSAQVNSAVSVLGNPVRRAVHLLELQGVELNAQNHTEKDTGFLMAQMELREALEEGRAARDRQTLEGLSESVALSYNEAQRAFALTQPKPGVGATAVKVDQQAIKALVSKMRFFEKLNDLRKL